MNDDDLRQQVQRGVQMRQLAETPGGLFEILDKVRVAYLETITETKAEDSKGREALYHRIRAHDQIVKVMKDVIREGANASKIIDSLTKQSTKRASHVA